MFPNAAISLSVDGITALLKADDGWRSIGQVPLDDPDLTGSLEALRLRAEAILGAPMRSKLIIPNDQIRFLEIDAVPEKISAGQTACAQALEGQTPYPINELRYDWTTTGTTTNIAAVAVETLTEAEAFATQYGLNPICFVGLPETGNLGTADLSIEPYFGTVKAAANLLDAQQRIDRETGLATNIGPWEDAPQSEPLPSLEPTQKPEKGTSDAPVKFFTRRTVPTDQLGAAPALGAATKATPEDATPPLSQTETPLPQKASLAPSTQPLAETTDLPEAEALTFSSARKTADTPSKSRFLGLILKGVLLAALFAAALIWGNSENSAISWMFGDKQSATQIAAPSDSVPAPDEQGPQRDENGLLPGPFSAFPTADEIDDAASEDFEGIATLPVEPLDPDRLSVRRVLPAPVETMTVNDAQALFERSGIWQRGVEPAALLPAPDLEATYFASLDPLTNFSDAVALPSERLLRQDAPVPRIGSPAAAGQTFDFDENGLVKPTANGAATPDGITVFAGQPPVVPPVREVIVPEPLPEIAETDNPLATFRPRLRPQSLSDANERETLGGYSRAELAALRPKLRPSDLAPTPVVAARPNNTSLVPLDQAQVDTAVASALATAAAQIPQGTAQAVRVSPKPNLRPRDLETTQTAALVPQTSQAATAAPVTQRPNGTVNSTVARNATLRNAIRFNRINLIGVSGKRNARNALVRLKNGRYRKVSVGDRLDGGRVTAIGRSDLRYSKSGRQVKLEIPSG